MTVDKTLSRYVLVRRVHDHRAVLFLKISIPKKVRIELRESSYLS